MTTQLTPSIIFTDSEWDSGSTTQDTLETEGSMLSCVHQSYHLNHSRTKLVCVRQEVKVLSRTQFQCEQVLVITLI